MISRANALKISTAGFTMLTWLDINGFRWGTPYIFGKPRKQ